MKNLANKDSFEYQPNNTTLKVVKDDLEYLNEVTGAYKSKVLILQKIIGFIILVLPIILCHFGLFYDAYYEVNDGTLLFITIPFGMYLIFTKDIVFR